MIKLWSINSLKNFAPGKQGSTAINMEPYLTLRGHTGPILTSCQAKDFLFTGGIEGIVKGWRLPTEDSITPYGESLPDGQTHQVFSVSLSKPNECVWDLNYNQYRDILLCIGAKNTIQTFYVKDAIDNDSADTMKFEAPQSIGS